jgi:hypothetical protein
MRVQSILAGAMLAASLAGCAAIPKNMTVADYCANPSKANENVCRLKVEIDGNSTALAETNISLNKARMIADTSLRAAADAQASADAAMSAANRAQNRADGAYSLANAAMMKDEDLVCNTRTVQKSAIGTCQPGYVVMGCTQTRYTHRAGGLSFLREVTNEQCRFNSQVLEMQVRCCTTAETAKTPRMSTAGGY